MNKSKNQRFSRVYHRYYLTMKRTSSKISSLTRTKIKKISHKIKCIKLKINSSKSNSNKIKIKRK